MDTGQRQCPHNIITQADRWTSLSKLEALFYSARSYTLIWMLGWRRALSVQIYGIGISASGLGWSRKDAVYRLLSSLTVTILYSLILVICNVSPESGNLLLVGLSWSELELVKYPFSRKTAITPMFFEQIEKFQCLLLSTGQGPSRGILRIHVGTCHVPQNVSQS